MRKNFSINNLARYRQNAGEFWGVEYKDEEGEGVIHYFPTDTVEWRAAEYDLDASTPEARDVIYDVILHEEYVPTSRRMKQNDRGIYVMEEPITLYNAPTKAIAWEALQERLANVKDKIARVNWPDQGKPLGKPSSGPVSMRQMLCDHEPDHAAIERKRDEVFKHRVQRGLETPKIVIPVSRMPIDPTLSKANANRKVIELG